MTTLRALSLSENPNTGLRTDQPLSSLLVSLQNRLEDMSCFLSRGMKTSVELAGASAISRSTTRTFYNAANELIASICRVF